jgi:hypothetical protein
MRMKWPRGIEPGKGKTKSTKRMGASNKQNYNCNTDNSRNIENNKNDNEIIVMRFAYLTGKPRHSDMDGVHRHEFHSSEGKNNTYND